MRLYLVLAALAIAAGACGGARPVDPIRHVRRLPFANTTDACLRPENVRLTIAGQLFAEVAPGASVSVPLPPGVVSVEVAGPGGEVTTLPVPAGPPAPA